MWQVFIIFVCICLNAILAAAELAFVSVSKSQMRALAQEGDPRALRVLKLRANPEKTLSVLQLGITFVGIIAAAVGGVSVDEWLTPYLRQEHGFSVGVSQFMAIAFFVVPYTYLNVILSELLPKSLAFRNPKWTIFYFSRWLVFLGNLLAPIVFLLEKTTKFGVGLCSPFFNKEEGAEEPLFSAGHLLKPYMMNLVEMENKTIADVMIPWERTVTIDFQDSIEKVEQVLLETGHTRLPVLKEKKPMGLLHSKEFMNFRRKGETKWQSLLHELLQVSERDSLISTLCLMQRKHSHLSLVTQGERAVGMITIEDIIEEVVGEIYDEDDQVQR